MNEPGPPLRVLFCGSRAWDDQSVIELVMHGVKSLSKDLNREPVVIEGEARGADTHTRVVAGRVGVEVVRVPADRDQYGNRAGYIRNQEMLDLDPHIVIAFADDINTSKGTLMMCRLAKRAGVPVYVVSRFGEEQVGPEGRRGVPGV